MKLKIESYLEKFKNINDFEFEGRKFKTNVQSVAPKAYLSIIYDAADINIQKEIIDPLELPSQLRNFYRYYNGVSLFADLFSIYGFLPHHYLLSVIHDWRKSLPYHFVKINERFFKDIFNSEILFFGSYGYDRSELFIEKSTGKIYCCVEDNLNKIRASWPSFENWIEFEIKRLASYHDENGNIIVDLKDTLPNEMRI